MKKSFLLTFTFTLALAASEMAAQVAKPIFKGKQLYIPKDLQAMNLCDTASQWSYARMDTTANIVIFWEKGFDSDPQKAPQLEGHNMTFDLENLKNRLEADYVFFRDTLQFVRKGSKSEQYRMMVMVNYSLEGTAYGGDYDQTIGALWLAPNRIQDRQLNCIAHELGHSFQCQLTADGQGVGWGGCGFYEMASQWMLWQMNPRWMDDENYHWQAFRKTFHKAFLHLENIYHSPYVLEYWGMQHGRPFIAELFRKGKEGDDPVMTYQQLTGQTQTEFCNDMFRASTRMVNLDYPRVWNVTRPHALQLITPTVADNEGWLKPVENCLPENYGFNVMEIAIPAGKHKVAVRFEGLGAKDATTEQASKAGWRYGFVGVTKQGKSMYGPIYNKVKGKAHFSWSKTTEMAHVYFVVMGAPTTHWKNPEEGVDAKWCYRFKP